MQLGLPRTQARVYLSLLQAFPATATQLSERARVARPKVYEALQALERSGFCSARGERVAVYEPVAPETALAEWVRGREQERRLAAEQDERVRTELVRELPLLSDASPADGEPVMEALIGKSRTAEMFAQLVGLARQSLDIVQAPPFVQPRETWNVLEAEAIERGVQVRVLFTTAAVSDSHRYVSLLEAGGEGRVSDRLILKLALRDGSDAMIALPDASVDEAAIAETSFTAVRITHPDLVSSLQLLFRREWRRAKRLGA